MIRLLNPIQQAILANLAISGSLHEDQMVNLVTPKTRLSAQDRLSWNEEIRMQAELLCLYGLIRMVGRSSAGQRIYVATPAIVDRVRVKRTRSSRTARPLMSKPVSAILAVVLASTGCSMMPSSLRQDQTSAATSIPRYNPERTQPPERIEQFSSNGNLVYRFCNGLECPQPTPKRPAIRPMPTTTIIDEVPTATDPLPVMVADKGSMDTAAPKETQRTAAKEKRIDKAQATPASEIMKTPKAAKDDPTASTQPDGAEEFVLGWARLWSEKNGDAYFALYAKDFQPNNGEKASAWMGTRSNIMSRPGEIKVAIEGAKVTEKGDKVTIQFWQTYRSPTFRSRVLKSLELIRAESGWKIRKERVIPVGA